MQQAIPKQLKEDIFLKEKSSVMAPTLVLDSDLDGVFNIWAENSIIATGDGIIEAVAGWISSYYVFNFTFPPPYKRTLHFYQKFVLKLECKTKSPQAVLALLNKIEYASLNAT